MPSDYDKIRAANIKEYREGTRHLSVLGELYTNRTHFVFELLQNAEDAEASRILFRLFNDRLEVLHDGRSFNELDVRGVCGIGEGTKAEDLTQIGKFGIGFKAVYTYTSTPEIHSGNESFHIEKYVRPHAVKPRKIGDSWTTLFSFNFNADAYDPETACREIGERLRQLNARTLLFLRNINKIEYKLPDLTGGIYLREEIDRDPARKVTVTGQNNGLDEDEDWLIFERTVPVPDCNSKVHVEVGFLLETSSKNNTESITRIKDAPLVVYFPTEKATRLGFLIQGPYRTTPARDNIPGDDAWNKGLVEETAILVKDTLQTLKNRGLLSVSLLKAMPIQMEEFPEDSMFYPIFDAVRESFMQEELLPTEDQSFVSSENAKLAPSNLIKLLNHKQLKSLLKVEGETKWISSDITERSTPDIVNYLTNALSIEEIDSEVFARRLNLQFLEDQSDEWFMRFYIYLSHIKSIHNILMDKPILRLQDNRHEKPSSPDDQPKAFLPTQEDTGFPIVKREIISENKIILDFLKSINLSEPNKSDDIVKNVLYKYNNPPADSISHEEHAQDIKRILDAMLSDSISVRESVCKACRETPFLWARNKAGDTELRKPGEIYKNTDELQDYFSSTPNTWFLCDTAADMDLENNPWKKLGVAVFPRRILSDSRPIYHRYRAVTEENFDLDGLCEFLESLQNMTDIYKRNKKSRILWDYLNNYIENNLDFFCMRKKWPYYNKTKYEYFGENKILDRLKQEKWIPTKEGGMKTPVEIMYVHMLDEYRYADQLINSLVIQRESDPAESEVGKAINELKRIKQHPNYQQLEPKPKFPTNSPVDRARRQKKFKEQLSDSPRKTYYNKQRRVRIPEIRDSTRQQLTQYYMNEDSEMICQLCHYRMPFRKQDGYYYFEAIEALKIESLKKEDFTIVNEAQFLALCPLCAARYKEFIRKDKESILNLKNSITNSDLYELFEFPLRLGDIDYNLRFVEKHYLDLKDAIQHSMQDD